jgi:hypothetical protein
MNIRFKRWLESLRICISSKSRSSRFQPYIVILTSDDGGKLKLWYKILLTDVGIHLLQLNVVYDSDESRMAFVSGKNGAVKQLIRCFQAVDRSLPDPKITDLERASFVLGVVERLHESVGRVRPKETRPYRFEIYMDYYAKGYALDPNFAAPKYRLGTDDATTGPRSTR